MIDLSSLAKGELNDVVYEALRRMCRALVHRNGYPAVYSPTGQWDDEGYDDIVHDWFTNERQALMVFAAQPDWFWWNAEKSLQRFILNHRQRTVAVALYRQVIRVLRSSSCFRERESNLWGLSEWSGTEPIYDGFEPALLRAIGPIGSGRPLTKAGRLRAQWVRESLEGLLGRLGMWIRAGDMCGALLVLMGATQGIILSVVPADDEGAGVFTGRSGGNSEVDALVSVAAAEALKSMSDEQKAVLFALATTDGSSSAVAKVLGTSQPTASKRLKDVIDVIQTHSPEVDLCELVLKKAQEIVISLTS